MNKNGFSFIEMMVTLVILSIIMAIAIPAYQSYIASSQKESFKTAERSLIDASTTAMLECVNNRKSSFCKDKKFPQKEEEYTLLSLQELIENGYMDPIHDPVHRGKYCDSENSYGYVLKNKEAGSGGYTYYSCLKCNGYESKDCSNEVFNK
ncbi:MAG: pilin [Bacilli bacterium]|nr:pilin [Bacilli bacterium]